MIFHNWTLNRLFSRTTISQSFTIHSALICYTNLQQITALNLIINHYVGLITMKKKIAVYTFIVMCLGFIVGLVLIFSAPTRGIYEVQDS